MLRYLLRKVYEYLHDDDFYEGIEKFPEYGIKKESED